MAAVTAAALAQDYPRTDDHRNWNKPAAPFRIVGPIHYVGTFDLASYLSSDLEVVNTPRYPTLVDDFKRTFAFLKQQTPDVFLTQHASAFALHDKAKRLTADAAPNPFIDPEGYREWLTRSERSFLARLAPK